MRPRAETRWDRRDSVVCWRAALFLFRSACLLRALTSSLERFLWFRVLNLLRSLRCSSTSINHEGTTRLGLCQLSMCLRQMSTCLPPWVPGGPGPWGRKRHEHYIYTLAQIRPLHCTISSLALRRSATKILAATVYANAFPCICMVPPFFSLFKHLHLQLEIR